MPRAQPIDRARARQHHHPAGDGRSRRIVAGGITPDLREDILHDFFRQIGLAKHPQRQAIDRSAITIVQLGDGIAGSARHRADGRAIARRVLAGPRDRWVGQDVHEGNTDRERHWIE